MRSTWGFVYHQFHHLQMRRTRDQTILSYFTFHAGPIIDQASKTSRLSRPILLSVCARVGLEAHGKVWRTHHHLIIQPLFCSKPIKGHIHAGNSISCPPTIILIQTSNRVCSSRHPFSLHYCFPYHTWQSALHTTLPSLEEYLESERITDRVSGAGIGTSDKKRRDYTNCMLS